MSENRFQCPHEADADFICNVLIAELSASKTLYNKLMISQAIMDLRQFVKPMVVEWEYISQR